MIIVCCTESATKGSALFAAKTFKAAELCIAQLKKAMPNKIFTIFTGVDDADERYASLPRIAEDFDLYKFMVSLEAKRTSAKMRSQL